MNDPREPLLNDSKKHEKLSRVQKGRGDSNYAVPLDIDILAINQETDISLTHSHERKETWTNDPGRSYTSDMFINPTRHAVEQSDWGDKPENAQYEPLPSVSRGWLRHTNTYGSVVGSEDGTSITPNSNSTFSVLDCKKKTKTEVEMGIRPRHTAKGVKGLTLQECDTALAKAASCLESLDYDLHENTVWQNATHLRDSKAKATRASIRWILVACVGVLTALVSVAITNGTQYFVKLKRNMVDWSVGEFNSSPYGAPLALFVLFNLGLVGISATLVAIIEPAASGSGVPEVKSLLNGIKIPRCVRMKTLFTKIIGLIMSVASGLPVGKQGPMIHCGAIIAAGISQGKSTTMGFDTKWTKFRFFRNDAEKRDMIACGAAAGVASAFGAPIGGVLFCMEDGTSFWTKTLTWRTFFCATIASWILSLCTSGSPGLFYFGSGYTTRFEYYELFFFLLVGCVGGLLGAAFNWSNTIITRLRLAKVHWSRPRQVFEAVVLSFTVSTIFYMFPLIFGKCSEAKEDSYNVDDLVQFFCPKGQFNDLAVLFLNPAEKAITQLLHFSTDTQEDEFSLLSLLVFAISFYFFTLITYGVSVPGGVFIPSMLCGAAWGRLLANSVNRFVGRYVVTFFFF